MFHQRSEPVQLGCKNKKQREKARNENRKRQRNQRKYKNQSKTTPKQKTNINKGPVYTFEGDTNVVGIVYPGGKSIAEYNDTELSN